MALTCARSYMAPGRGPRAREACGLRARQMGQREFQQLVLGRVLLPGCGSPASPKSVTVLAGCCRYGDARLGGQESVCAYAALQRPNFLGLVLLFH
jgi:hypothetical protein